MKIIKIMAMEHHKFNRRRTLKLGTAGITSLLVNPSLSSQYLVKKREFSYQQPRVIIIRFGGGVRRQETINIQGTSAPFMRHILAKEGTLFSNMELEQSKNVTTSHGQGTLYILTGKYQKYEEKFLSDRFEPTVPTLFEYLRKQYHIPEEETLIINGEDRTSEEFYSFSNHHSFGVNYRSQVLSLYRFKIHLLKKQILSNQLSDKVLEKKQKELEKLQQKNYRLNQELSEPFKLTQFWEEWHKIYGETGLVNPRGDRLLTELAVWAIQRLKPKLLMINYNDPDYVHWGYKSHYTLGISIIDQGIKRLVNTIKLAQEYRDNTVFCIVPDCGRDSNPFLAVPYQHHFNSKSAHEIFALFWGKGIKKNQIIERRVSQIDIAPTIAKIMGFHADYAEGKILEEVFM
ncbi:MAG: sulfatase-like hydrolase/transferase [Crocosphaera sp.]|nr:sulfatase-like hydrolase/transferase [Crocosphaera sp.]